MFQQTYNMFQGRLTKFKCSNFIAVSNSPIIFFYCLLVRCGYFWYINPHFRRFFNSPFRLFRNKFFLCSSIGKNFAFTHLTFVSESSLFVFYFLCVLAPFFILFFVHASFFLRAVFMHRCITYPFIVHKTSKTQCFNEGFCQFGRFNSLLKQFRGMWAVFRSKSVALFVKVVN